MKPEPIWTRSSTASNHLSPCELAYQGSKLLAEELTPARNFKPTTSSASSCATMHGVITSSGTCAIGPTDQGGVLSSDFKVHGTQGLRVVDASVFPAYSRLLHRQRDLHDQREGVDVILADSHRS